MTDTTVAEQSKRLAPSLLYLADVPVESSYHGSALLFRLLQNYPPQKLRIIESGPHRSLPERRLPGLLYHHLSFGGEQWLNTRFHRWVSSWLTLRATICINEVSELLDNFNPAAVLTVAHGYGWLTAAQYATDRRLPLHLIVHDDLTSFTRLVAPLQTWFHKKFGEVYRKAVSRFCVSPFMVETYERCYGVWGTVLYPSRAADNSTFTSPPGRLGSREKPLTVAFAGTVNSQGYVRALVALATALDTVCGRLFIFGPLTTQAAQQGGLMRPNITLGGLLTQSELLRRFREEIDVLFIPMSFDTVDRTNMEIAFPSKLSDYTAVGLPMLIYAPPYSSVVRWAEENSGIAEVVIEENPLVLRKAIRRLATEPAYRIALGSRALEIGYRYFSHEAGQQLLYQALTSRRTMVDSLDVA